MSSTAIGSGDTVKIIVTNFATRELKGKKVTPVKTDIDNQSYFSFIADSAEGIYHFATQQPGDIKPKINASPIFSIKYPIKVGTSWDSKAATSMLHQNVPIVVKSVIESIDDVVTVPAGTFKGCMKIKGIGKTNLGTVIINFESYSWNAPGVGNIKAIGGKPRGGKPRGRSQILQISEQFNGILWSDLYS